MVIQKKLAERKAKWQALFRKSPGSSYLESKDLKKLVRKGLPDSSRGEVWMDISGASKLLAANPGSYRRVHLTSFHSAVLYSTKASIMTTQYDCARFCSVISKLVDWSCVGKILVRKRCPLHAFRSCLIFVRMSRKLVDTANAGCAADSKAQIELDLPRTFPDHMHFRGEMETPLVKSLRNVLMAYANRNKVFDLPVPMRSPTFFIFLA